MFFQQAPCEIHCWSRSLRPAQPNQYRLRVTSTGSSWNGGPSAALLGPLGLDAGFGGPRHKNLEPHKTQCVNLVWIFFSPIMQHCNVLKSLNSPGLKTKGPGKFLTDEADWLEGGYNCSCRELCICSALFLFIFGTMNRSTGLGQRSPVHHR